MEDFEMTLDNNEMAFIHCFIGNDTPLRNVTVFLWKECDNKMSVSISIEGIEKKALEVTNLDEITEKIK